MFDLKDKRVLIIGGGGILGSTIARGFLDAGAKIAIGDIRPGIVKELGFKENEAMELQINALEKESIQASCDTLKKEWGGLDVLINAAGGNSPKATVTPDQHFSDLDMEGMEKVFKLNYFGGGVLPIMVYSELFREQGEGIIINISSMSARLPLTRVVGYSSAKAAIDNLTKWCAVEFARKYGRKIRVNAIAPGFFLTDQNRYLLTDEKTGELSDRGKTIISQTPMGEFGKPEELVGACLFLASDASAFITGVVLPIDGGFSAFSGV